MTWLIDDWKIQNFGAILRPPTSRRVWRTIFVTLPLYVIVHTVHFEVSHDMVHQMYVKNIIKNGPELGLYVTMRKNMGIIFF